jgi:RES domain-containing protein
LIVYRIAATPHIKDLSGMGASLFGGRWNPKGVPLVYTSESRSLAALELYANRSKAGIVMNLSLAAVAIPGYATVREVPASELPAGWNRYPAPLELAIIGSDWAASLQSLVLCVPSALVPQERNYLLNPLHPHMADVAIAEIEEYTFDQRFPH